MSFFVVAHNSPGERDETRNALKKLASRKWQKRHRQTEEEEESSSMSTQSVEAELERRRMRKKKVLRRFRYSA